MTVKEEHHLDALNKKHQQLSEQIREYELSPGVDGAVIHQLKKEKLLIKDEIVAFKRQLMKDALDGAKE